MIVKDRIPKFNTIGAEEISMVYSVMQALPLSGFLGGQFHGGTYVQALERVWEDTFHTRHAIACNSATSGLLAVAAAINLGPRDTFLVPALTMSATAAAPMLLGAKPAIVDVEDDYFCMEDKWHGRPIFITNLFGHPSCLTRSTYVIEDNAQAPFARYNGAYSGVIGHMGVFSLNVHKHIQCGEGGIVVTNDDRLAEKVRLFINHGELAGEDIGLNLRMTEVTAAIALAQLEKGEKIVAERIAQAEKIMASIGNIPGLIHPKTRDGCKHVYYALAFRFQGNRDNAVVQLMAEGVPVKAGYLPLTQIPAFKPYATPCPVAERLDKEFILFENCAYSPTDEQIDQIGQAFRKVMT